MEIRDHKGCENVVAYHLSRLENLMEGGDARIRINEDFSDEHVIAVVDHTPWYADFVNFLIVGVLPTKLSNY